jgi:tRNA(Ile)-lysidine synthase
MLLLAQATIPGQFEVGTVDHGLRAESAAECALVARLCARFDVRCAILKVAVAPGNLQASARAARYVALGDWATARGLSAIATAHHADDQAETLLMRLNRGSGVAGLAGVRDRSVVPGGDLPLIRPLLSLRRAELARVVAAAEIDPVQDPSNANPRYDRVKVRQGLGANTWLDPAALAASAAHLADADEALAWAAEREWQAQTSHAAGELRYRRTAPRAVALRVIERAIATIGGDPRGQDVARLLDRLERGEGGNLAGVLATVEGEMWLFRPEPPRR